MAPPKQAPGPPFAKDEKVLCFHGDLMYEAKITDLRSASDHSNTNAATIKADDAQYRVHYKGWKASWDDWVLQDRMRKFTDDNKALAAQLQQAARLRTVGGSKSAKKAIGKAVGGPGGDSEMSSARGSEERLANNTYGRGPRRGRDYELENVSPRLSFVLHPCCVGVFCQVQGKNIVWRAVGTYHRGLRRVLWCPRLVSMVD